MQRTQYTPETVTITMVIDYVLNSHVAVVPVIIFVVDAELGTAVEADVVK